MKKWNKMQNDEMIFFVYIANIHANCNSRTKQTGLYGEENCDIWAVLFRMCAKQIQQK